MDIKILFSSENKLKNKLIRTFIILSLAFIFYSIVIFFIKGFEIIDYSKNNYWVILQCSSLIIPIIFFKILRWRLLCKKVGLKISLFSDIKTWVGSQAFLATPGGAGLGIRSILLKKKFGLPISQTLPIILYERIIDLVSVTFIIFLLKIRFFMRINILIPIIIAIFIVCTFYSSIKHFIYQFLYKFFPLQKKSAIQFLNSFKMLLNLRLNTLSIFIGICPWLVEGYSLNLIINNIGQFEISWYDSLFTHLLATLLGALSFLPGGLAATEFSIVGLLSLFKIPLEVSTTSGILIRLLTIWLATIIGMITLILPSKTDLYSK